MPNFNIRRSVLSAFRDKVLLKVLVNATRLAELEAMLFIVILETNDESPMSKKFSDLAQQVMGLPKVCFQIMDRSADFYDVSIFSIERGIRINEL